MSDQQEPDTWQALLGQLIADPQEKARLAAAIRVRPITLHRWAEKVSKPREEHVHALIKNLPPESYPLFMSLLISDFPGLLREELPKEQFSARLPSEFYARILSNLALTPQPLYRQSTQELILQQMLEHLDPNRHGLLITLAVCVPPQQERKVRSLREIVGAGTPPWPRNLAEKPMFLGAESLAGHAITHGRPYVLNKWEEMTRFSPHWTDHQRSIAAFPLWRHACIAGSLIISSVSECFFTQPCLSVIESYTHLAACIFEPGEVFAPDKIELRIMPSYALQHPYFAGYNQRVLQKFARADAMGQQVTLQQACQLVWQDLEEVLIEVFVQTAEASQVDNGDSVGGKATVR